MALAQRQQRLRTPVQQRQRERGLAGALTLLAALPMRPLVDVQPILVVEAPSERSWGPTLPLLEVPITGWSLRRSELLPATPPAAERLPRGRARCFPWQPEDRPLARVCVKLEIERGTHRGFSPRLSPGDRLVSALWVAPQARGRGIARTMVDSCLAATADAGTSGGRVLALVHRDNRPSRSVFDALGFTTAEQRRVLRLPGDRRLPLVPHRRWT